MTAMVCLAWPSPFFFLSSSLILIFCYSIHSFASLYKWREKEIFRRWYFAWVLIIHSSNDRNCKMTEKERKCWTFLDMKLYDTSLLDWWLICFHWFWFLLIVDCYYYFEWTCNLGACSGRISFWLVLLNVRCGWINFNCATHVSNYIKKIDKIGKKGYR